MEPVLREYTGAASGLQMKVCTHALNQNKVFRVSGVISLRFPRLTDFFQLTTQILDYFRLWVSSASDVAECRL